MKIEGLGWRMLRNIILFLGLVLIIVPLFLVFINTFKTLPEASESLFALPSGLNIENYRELFKNSQYWTYAWNSTLITLLSLAIELLLVPSVSYAIARNPHHPYYKFVYYFLLMGLFIPSQVIMLPVTKFMTKLKLLNQFGLILLYATFSLTRGVFMFVNYYKSLPYEIEEAARVDGCNVMSTYIRIVLPMVKPMVATLVVMDALWYWNDFLLPLLILNKSRNFWTLPLFQYNFKTEYSFNYVMAFTAYTVSMLPMLILYAFGQKYIISGLTAGAVKG